MVQIFRYIVIALFMSSSGLNLLFAQTNGIFINEFMASNSQTIVDELHEYDDWIEIYNDNELTINLSGYYLTDNLNDPLKWAFPDVTIASKGFLLIWADGTLEQGKLHTTFKLNASGEEIGLFDGHSFVDSLRFDAQTPDISYGRIADGGAEWSFFSKPTPDAPNSTSQYLTAEPPGFSYESGFYPDPIMLELTINLDEAEIYYTTDGSVPTQESEFYTGPIMLDSTKVIRARTFKANYHPSPIITHTYLINEQRYLPVLSLITDPYNLWDPDSGIYVVGDDPDSPNFKQDWERPIYMEFFERNGALEFSSNGGVRIHGGTSVWFDKKSFRLYFRGEYGTSWLKYPLFHKKNITEFKRLVVASGTNDCSSDQRADTRETWSLIRDVLMHDLSYESGVLYTAKLPSFVYLNGKPWGIHYLSERIDKYCLETNYGVKDADIVEFNHHAKEGNEARWNELLSFIQNNDLQLNKNYEMLTQLIDIENFIDYNIIEIYGGNRDWPHNNCYCYRPHGDNQVWRWIMWDADVTFGSPPQYDASSNTLNWATRLDHSTLILKNLFRNEIFQQDFGSRFADLLNSLLLPARVKAKIDSLAEIIRPEIPIETQLWSSHPSKWEDHIQAMKEYVELRPAYLWRQVGRECNAGDLVELTIQPPDGGEGNIQINTLFPSTHPWKGIYYSKIPITLHAHPSPGYQFAGWSDASLSDTAVVMINPKNDYSIFAYFEKKNIPGKIVINEINYNSSSDFDPEDWIELYNPNDEAIDLADWHFKDKNDENDFVLPAEGGELIRIFSPSGVLIDSVTYDDSPPWPIEADGLGSTLELIDPGSDNSIPASWHASATNGSPAQPNPIITAPVIFHLRIDSISARSAVVSWKTDRSANSQLEYGLDENYGMTTAVDSQLVSHHSVKLSGLQASTTYHVRAKSEAADGAVGFSDDFTFNTLDSSFLTLRITSITVESITANSATIQWETERPATSQVLFGVDQNLENATVLDTQRVMLHEIELSNLSPATTYYFQVGSHDSCGVEQWSEPFSFSTFNISDSLDITLQIEVMSHRTDGRYEAPGWNFGNNGRVSQFLEFKRRGFYKFTVSARGEPAKGIWPEFQLSLDDTTLASKTVHVSDFDTLSVTAMVDSGWCEISIAFTNYFSDSAEIRSLNVDWLRIQYLYSPVSAIRDYADMQVPCEWVLHQNYPNPANPMTRIQFLLPQKARVIVTIFNLFGQEVRMLVNSMCEAGSHSILWNGRDNLGQPVASGIYLCQLNAKGIVKTRKIIVLR